MPREANPSKGARRINPLRRWLIGLLFAAPGEVYLDLLKRNYELERRIADAREALR